MIRTLARQIALLPLAGLLFAGQGECATRDHLAQKRYVEASAVEGSGDLDGAERLYRQILADYPQTEGAAGAERQMERIRQRREQLHKESFMPVLHRLRKIVESYPLLTGRMPRELADFDSSESLLDSHHLAQVVPEGFVAYLQLEPEKEEFLVYAFRDGSETGYRVDRRSPVLYNVPRNEFQGRLGKELAETGRKGNLIVLRGNRS